MAAKKRKSNRTVLGRAYLLVGYDRRGNKLVHKVIGPRASEYDEMDTIIKVNRAVVRVESTDFDGKYVSEMTRAEALLSVYYTYAFPPDEEGSRNVMRVPINADIGIDYDPAFTVAEMNQIMFAAKMEATKILLSRPKKRRMRLKRSTARRTR